MRRAASPALINLLPCICKRSEHEQGANLTMNEAAARYCEQGRVYLDQANDEFAGDDWMQASEKAWGGCAASRASSNAQRCC